MNHTEPKRLDIERFVTRELNQERAVSLEKHINECKPCSEYYHKLCRERDSFLRIYPFETITMTQNSKEISWWKKITDYIAKPILVPVYATLLIGAVLLPIMIQNGFFNNVNTIQYKGNSVLTFVYQRDGQTLSGTNRYTIKPGDKVQILYTSDREQYVSLVSLDRAGEISFYHPDQLSEFCSVKTGNGEGIAFPGSIEFDQVNSDELVMMLFSSVPLKTADIKQWISKNFTTQSDLQKIARKLENNYPSVLTKVQILLLKKG